MNIKYIFFIKTIFPKLPFEWLYIPNAVKMHSCT